MGVVEYSQATKTFKIRKLGYKYRVLRQRIRPVIKQFMTVENLAPESLPEKINQDVPQTEIK